MDLEEPAVLCIKLLVRARKMYDAYASIVNIIRLIFQSGKQDNQDAIKNKIAREIHLM